MTLKEFYSAAKEMVPSVEFVTMSHGDNHGWLYSIHVYDQTGKHLSCCGSNVSPEKALEALDEDRAFITSQMQARIAELEGQLAQLKGATV